MQIQLQGLRGLIQMTKQKNSVKTETGKSKSVNLYKDLKFKSKNELVFFIIVDILLLLLKVFVIGIEKYDSIIQVLWLVDPATSSDFEMFMTALFWGILIMLIIGGIRQFLDHK